MIPEPSLRRYEPNPETGLMQERSFGAYCLASDVEQRIEKLEAENARLREWVAELEPDVRRYRWLREFRSPTLMLPFIAIHGPGGYSQWVGERADERIDLALAAIALPQGKED